MSTEPGGGQWLMLPYQEAYPGGPRRPDLWLVLTAQNGWTGQSVVS